MKRVWISFSIVLFALVGIAAGPLDNAVLHGETDKDRAIEYAIGEPMVFTLSLQGAKDFNEGEYLVKWTRTGDDGIREAGETDLKKLPLVIKTKIDKPGFVRIRAEVFGKDGKKYVKEFTGDATTPEGREAMNRFERGGKHVFFDGGAGAAVDQLKVNPEPADFDAFWAGQFARLEAVPMEVLQRKEVPCRNEKVRIYAISIACAGLRPVTGYLSVPKAVDEGITFPARLTTHGYSGDNCTHRTPDWKPEGEIQLDINAHGLKLAEFGGDAAYTKQLRWEIRSNGRSYAFDPKQNEDAETAYFNGMVLRVKRALQYLKTVKGWNGKDLIASGGSQGGLQTIWAAACGEGVTKAESGITWCCDMYTNGKHRSDKSKNMASDGWYIQWTEAMGYYDAAICAKRIPATCYTIITRAGLGDYCCPPTGLVKMWNNMSCPKKINWVQGSTHGYVPPEPHQQFSVGE